MSSQDQYDEELSGYGAAQEGTGEDTPAQELPDTAGQEPGGARVEIGGYDDGDDAEPAESEEDDEDV